jgi:hypothetical protein
MSEEYDEEYEERLRVKCSLCNDSFPNDQDLVTYNGQEMKLIEVRKLRHEEFKHPESKNDRNVIPKYGRKIEWIMIKEIKNGKFIASRGTSYKLLPNERLEDIRWCENCESYHILPKCENKK